MVLFLAACDSSGSSDDDDEDPSGSVVEVYVPTGTVQGIDFSGKTVVAKYAKAVDAERETIGGVTYRTEEIDAIILYDDNTFVTSERKIYINKSTGVQDGTKEKIELDEKGTFALNSGSYSDGSVTINQTHDWESETSSWEADAESVTVTVSGGKFTKGNDKYTKVD